MYTALSLATILLTISLHRCMLRSALHFHCPLLNRMLNGYCASAILVAVIHAAWPRPLPRDVNWRAQKPDANDKEAIYLAYCSTGARCTLCRWLTHLHRLCSASDSSIVLKVVVATQNWWHIYPLCGDVHKYSEYSEYRVKQNIKVTCMHKDDARCISNGEYMSMYSWMHMHKNTMSCMHAQALCSTSILCNDGYFFFQLEFLSCSFTNWAVWENRRWQAIWVL